MLLALVVAADFADGAATSHVHLRHRHRHGHSPAGGLGSIPRQQVALRTRRKPPKKKRTLDDGPAKTDHHRLQNVLEVGAVAEDLETRVKPPFISIPGQEGNDRLTKQQRLGMKGIFDQDPDDMRDCILIHQYAEPLEVIDSFEMQGQVWGRLIRAGQEPHAEEETPAVDLGLPKDVLSTSTAPSLNWLPSFNETAHEPSTVELVPGADSPKTSKSPAASPTAIEEGEEDRADDLQGKWATAPVLVRPGAVYDSSTDDGSELHVSTTMMAKLEGISNPVQVIPHGPVSQWTSKRRVPIAGFLCMEKDKGDSAPVLHATPTPCVPTTIDAEGESLDPFLDPYEVFIGSTRVAFQNKVQAEKFCLAYAQEIARDLGTLVWDAEDLKGGMPEAKESSLARGDICYRFCEDGSEPPVDLRSHCPADAPCTSPLPSGMASYDTCADRAHTCGGVILDDAPGPAPAPSPELLYGGAPGPSEAEDVLAASSPDGAQSLLQTGASAAKASAGLTPDGNLRGPHGRSLRHRRLVPQRLAESRLWMAGGGHEDRQPFHEDRLGLGIRSLAAVQNPDLLNFVAGTRKRPTAEGWTLGTKKLLVLIMDWKIGDQSLSPFSQQDVGAVSHYQSKIFPRVQQHFRDMSYGQFDLDITFVPEVITYTRNRNTMAGRLPFPTLYNEARDALQSHPTYGHQFAFRDFDLVFVIHPQVNPIGTKGVAWVGSRGACCNGCETISDNFKIMVAVHELGHNLGLSHASSEALEYGNPFDWMGNYPDVQGLHYGMGYKRDLEWIPPEAIMDVTDDTVDGLNHMVTLSAFDVNVRPNLGEVVGVRISLFENKEDIYISFRSTAEDDSKGVFVVYQSKENPASKLLDASCHSPSQQDAHLKVGWTYMDDSHKVVVKVVEQADASVKVHLYRTPKVAHAVAGIRARSKFTDGHTKCPQSCSDSDLIISRSCEELKKQGFCTGKLKLQGKQMDIGTEVCPKTCGNCDEVMMRPPEVPSREVCDDANVEVSGMTCPALAKKDMCEMKTTSGKKLGADLCKKSCATCAKEPPEARPGTEGSFPDPNPTQLVGGGAGGAGGSCPGGCRAPQCRDGAAVNGGIAIEGSSCTARCSRAFGDVRFCGRGGEYAAGGSLDCSSCSAVQAGRAIASVCPSSCMGPVCVHGSPSNGGLHLSGSRCTGRCSKLFGDSRYCGSGGIYNEAESVDCSACGPALLPKESASEDDGVCEDDETWIDPDGNDCEFYRDTIAKWGRDKVCKEYQHGIGGLHCRSTCKTCKGDKVKSAGCADNACIGPWLEAYGRCFQCSDYAMGCTDPKYEDVFRNECPLTCGVCVAPDEMPSRLPAVEAGDAEEKGNITATTKKPCQNEDEKYCKALGKYYCSEGAFRSRCPTTCNLCEPANSEVETTSDCTDRFSSFTCQRYESYGWCTRVDTKAFVQLNCPVTCGLCGGWAPLPQSKANTTNVTKWTNATNETVTNETVVDTWSAASAWIARVWDGNWTGGYEWLSNWTGGDFWSSASRTPLPRALAAFCVTVLAVATA